MNNKSMTVFAEERKQQIVDLIHQKKKVSVKELCERFGTSSGTIRNDLKELEKMDLLSRTHGGAISVSKIGFERRTIEKVVKHQKEKAAIAKLAMDFVEDGDTIAIDTGTTTLEFAKLLDKRYNLTVVTNDFGIALLLENYSNITVMFIGGMIRKGFHCALGPPSIKALSEIRVDKTFLAANGISVKSGITTPDVDTAQIKRELIKIANEVFLLCDSSKIGRSSFMQIAGFEQINLLLTDANISEGMLKELKDAGLETRIAPVGGDVQKNQDNGSSR